MEKLLKIRRRSLLHIAGRAKRRGCTSQKNCLPRKITLHSKRQIKNALLILPVLIIALSVQAQDDPKPFVTTWETTGADKTITIPTVSEETYNYTINWGDDSAITTHTNATPPSHTYDEANTYTITISGFVGCSNLTIAEDAGGPDLSNVTDMSFMFLGSSFNGDLSEWDVSNVKNMEGTFEHSSFNGDLSEWDVSKVTNMSGMFFDTKFNQDISNWNTSKVTDMSDMFNSADFNQDISDWNVSSVTDMSFMFAGSITTTFFNGDLSKWDVSKVTNMEGMFYLSPFTGDLSDWDVSSVTNMSFMFAGESTIAPSFLNGDLSKWDISSVTDMTDMFTNNTSMSSENYDKLLIGWSTLDAGESQIPRDITFDAPDKYSCAGKDAREKLVNDYSWSIKGDELVELSADENPLQLLISEDPIISLTPPKATIGCSGGTKVTATHPDDLLPIESDTTITWTFTHGGKSIMQTQRVFIGDSFITTWETTEADETITIPTVDGETYNYTVNWGDGSDITTHTNATPPSHTYDEANTYTITIIAAISPLPMRQASRTFQT
ncbi:MAG: DUF285 domain-containing protein [Ekhidna sp.]|nr:DUF285 domain-containing protein [Ekhidna sp.]